MPRRNKSALAILGVYLSLAMTLPVSAAVGYFLAEAAEGERFEPGDVGRRWHERRHDGPPELDQGGGLGLAVGGYCWRVSEQAGEFDAEPGGERVEGGQAR